MHIIIIMIGGLFGLFFLVSVVVESDAAAAWMCLCG
jgi:hypothetical protein